MKRLLPVLLTACASIESTHDSGADTYPVPEGVLNDMWHSEECQLPIEQENMLVRAKEDIQIGMYLKWVVRRRSVEQVDLDSDCAIGYALVSVRDGDRFEMGYWRERE